MEIVLIAAIGKNRELGKGNDLVWRISEDLKRFKELTTGYPIIMGRKTFESIGRPLPNRTNIIVTRTPELVTSDVTNSGVVVGSIEQAIAAVKKTGAEKAFVIGGSQIFNEALGIADTLELTLIDAEDAAADVFFPEFEHMFKEKSRLEERDQDGVKYTYVTFERI